MSEYRSDEETVEAIQNWWRENGLFLVGAVVLALAGVFGWNYWQSQGQQRAEGASALYLAWQQAAGEEAAALADQLEDSYPRSTYLAFVRLHQARTAVEAGEVDAARAPLQAILESRVDDQVKGVARVRLARLELAAGDPEAALHVLEAAAETSIVAEVRGDALYQAGQPEAAAEAYETALRRAGEPRPLLQVKYEDLLASLRSGDNA